MEIIYCIYNQITNGKMVKKWILREIKDERTTTVSHRIETRLQFYEIKMYKYEERND